MAALLKKQVFNPFLPLNKYIPDGEPHIFGDRVYLYGSHDREGGHTFCMEDYEVFSAPVNDLSDWRSEGVIYRAAQDPMYETYQYMYAPDCVQGNDGRYYLYYCMSGEYGQGGYRNPISVAVCDEPAGQFEYLGYVRNKDGSPMMRYVCFDPAVMNDDGIIRLYYGTQYGYEEEEDFLTSGRLQDEIGMFGRSADDILAYEDSINGPIMLTLEDDMLTVREEPHHIIPYRVKGTDFEEHPFFEASSMRRIGAKYYFIYSSWQNHELCYAVSDYPDREFRFGGTIVSNGDVGCAMECDDGDEAGSGSVDGFGGGLTGRRSERDSLNMTGTTHGSILQIEGQWYVFYHRLTHKSDYSRQACAEKIEIAADGSIAQVEITSCGLNSGALRGEGCYPAVICCNLTNGHMPHGCNCIYKDEFPNVTNKGNERFIAEIEDGTLIGYKYWNFAKPTSMTVTVRPENEDTRVIFDGPERVDERSVIDKGAEVNAAGEQYFDVFVAASAASGASGTSGASGAPAESGGLGENCKINCKMAGKGQILIPKANKRGYFVGRISMSELKPEGRDWKECVLDGVMPVGEYAVYLLYHGGRKVQLKDIKFKEQGHAV